MRRRGGELMNEEWKKGRGGEGRGREKPEGEKKIK